MIELTKKSHRKQDVILIKFPYNSEMISCIKQHPNVKWSQSNKAWYIPNNKLSLEQLNELFPDLDISVYLSAFDDAVSNSSAVDRKQVNDKVRIEYTYSKIRIFLRKNENDIEFLKSFKYARWIPLDLCWTIPNYDDNLLVIRLHFGDRIVSIIEIKEERSSSVNQGFTSLEIPEEINLYTEKLRNWMEHKRYSPSSVKSYLEALRIFLAYTYPKPVESLNNIDIIDFVNNYIIKRNLSQSFQNHVINSIKLLFREVINSNIDIDRIERPRREKKLPNVLSKSEVKLILDSCENLKHRTVLSLVYACGLRRGEILKLKPSDINSSRNLLIIRNAKGKKDRVVTMSDKIIDLLREYYKVYKPKRWLFEGINEGDQYTASSIQKVLKRSVLKAGIRKPVSLHWLRHSYATHLLESGVDLRFIQELLGHNSSRTTEIYTHVSTKNLQNIKSPFDDL
jgi:integrase/recombinase XerD